MVNDHVKLMTFVGLPAPREKSWDTRSINVPMKAKPRLVEDLLFSLYRQVDSFSYFLTPPTRFGKSRSFVE